MQEPVTVVLSKKERIRQAKVVIQDKCKINENKKYDLPIGEVLIYLLKYNFPVIQKIS